MSDTQSTWLVRDGQLLPEIHPANILVDSFGHLIPQVAVRANNGPITTGNPMPMATAPTALTNSAAAVATLSSEIVVPFSATRKFLHVFSRTTGPETVDLGPANVTVGGGIPISSGGGFSFLGSGAAGPIYAITTVANSPLSYVEG